MIKIKKLIAFIFALVLVFSFGVSSFATSDSVLDGLQTGWGAYYNDLNAIGVPSGFTNSWFSRLLYAVQHVYTEIYSLGHSATISSLNRFFTDDISAIDDDGTNLWYLQSAIYYLGHELQNFEYYTPYSGGEATDFATAVNKNLLYLTNQLQVVIDNMGASSGSTSTSSGLMSGWSLSGVPAPDGYSTSWYYRMLQNSGSLATYFNRLYSGTWADGDNYGDGYFYRDYQNTSAIVNSLMRYEEPFLDEQYNTLGMMQGMFVPVQASYSSSVSNSLFALSYALCTRTTSPSYFDYLTDTSKSFTNYSWGLSLSAQIADQSSLISRLAYVFANDDDIAIKKDSENNTQAVNDNFLSSSGANSVKTDDISNLSSVSSSVKDTFATGTSPTGVFDTVNSDDPWEWFTEGVANSLLADSGTSVSTFSMRSSSCDNDTLVTTYYDDNLADLFAWLDLVG